MEEFISAINKSESNPRFIKKCIGANFDVPDLTSTRQIFPDLIEESLSYLYQSRNKQLYIHKLNV
jgi:hypothetical protein